MLISEIKNRDDVMSSIIKELNGIGIKIRNEKHKQPNVRKVCFYFYKNSNLTFLITE